MPVPQTSHPLDARFAALRAAGHKALIPFVPAGDPSLAATGEIVRALAAAGADVIEIGFPYSDPLADGPVIQASYTRALNAGLKLEALFAAAKDWAQAGPPLVGMAAYSLIHRWGLARFLAAARTAGFVGLIVPDLPLEEAAELAALAADHGLKLSQLATPTTPADRAARIAQLSTGFLYVVSVTGITGERAKLSATLGEQLKQLRSLTALPLCVGFGVSDAAQARTAAAQADGVIVGSALVKHLEGTRPWREKLQALAAHAAELRAAV